MTTTAKEKYQLSMAGEYGVCAELCKRGFDASITFGNMKATDIFVVIGTVLRRIEVYSRTYTIRD